MLGPVLSSLLSIGAWRRACRRGTRRYGVACGRRLHSGNLKRFEEVKSLLGKTMPVARRVLGDSHDDTLRMRTLYAMALCNAKGATLDDLRKAVTTLEETERTMRRVLGGAHPLTMDVERDLQNARAALRARDTPSANA